MRRLPRLITALLGAGFVLQGLGWLLAPERAAAGLGMSLQDGIGRSTEIGDFAAFFLTAGATMLAGLRAGRSRLLLVPAGLLASAAFGRTVAWAVHGAAFATPFVAVEVLASALLVTVVRRGDAPLR